MCPWGMLASNRVRLENVFVGCWMFWKLSTKLICIVYKNNNFPGRAFCCCYVYCLSSSVVAQREPCDDKSS